MSQAPGSPTPPPPERRAAPRQVASSYVRVECRKGMLGLGPDLTTECVDISELGIGLILKEALDPPVTTSRKGCAGWSPSATSCNGMPVRVVLPGLPDGRCAAGSQPHHGMALAVAAGVRPGAAARQHRQQSGP
jgi:hypothetical protein